jgi:hypothetical protein
MHKLNPESVANNTVLKGANMRHVRDVKNDKDYLFGRFLNEWL